MHIYINIKLNITHENNTTYLVKLLLGSHEIVGTKHTILKFKKVSFTLLSLYISHLHLLIYETNINCLLYARHCTRVGSHEQVGQNCRPAEEIG